MVTAIRADPRPGLDRDILIQTDVMKAPVVWLASEASSDINGRRFIGQFWDESVPIEERLEKASAPAAWPEKARQAIPPR